MARHQYGIGDIVLSNWRLVKKLGQGSYGTVYEAHRVEFGITYKTAIKVISIPYDESDIYSARAEGMSEQSITDYYRELTSEIVQEFVLMAKLKGMTNIVSYEDHAVIEHTEEIGFDILIRMELLQPLLIYMNFNQMTQMNIVRMGIDICKALEICQKHNIIHRDIKPENMFVSDCGDFVLGDFGIARTVEKTLGNMSKKGTYTYMAPEIYREDVYGPNVDIYSLGIVMYRLLNFNRTPFLPLPPNNITHSDREVALLRRFSGEEIPEPINATAELAHIVLKACAYDPKERYASPREMRIALAHVLPHLETEEMINPSHKTGVAGCIERDADECKKSADIEGEMTVSATTEQTIISGTSEGREFTDVQKSYATQKPKDKRDSQKHKKLLQMAAIAVCAFALLNIIAMKFLRRHESGTLIHNETISTTVAEETEYTTVMIGNEAYQSNAVQIRIGHFEGADLEAIKSLSKLQTVVVFNDGSVSEFSQLKAYCEDCNIDFKVEIAGKTIANDSKRIELDEVTEEDAALFHLLTDKEQISIRYPKCSAETLLGLEKSLISTEVSWVCDIADIAYSSNTIPEEINLAGKEIKSLQSLQEQLEYFTAVKEVYLGAIAFGNEEVAAFRERVKDRYKVVWEVSCGELSLRTDAEILIPEKTETDKFTDSDACNLQYCNEMKAVNLENTMITNIEFVKFMPKLKYLSISGTDVKNIIPLSQCSELIFLELNNCSVKDFSPLKKCTKLEDLNVGGTNADFSTLYDMSWLKNLYMINCPQTEVQHVLKRFPNMNVVAYGNTTVSNGWRELQNYYDMRDLLGMPYLPDSSTKIPEVEAVHQTTGLGIVVDTESGVNIRSGAGTGYPSSEKYLPNTAVEILETTTVEGTLWGRTDKGWISMDYVELVKNDNVGLKATTGTQYTGKIINSPYLNVRENPSTQATLVGSVTGETGIMIYETTISENMAWGRCNMGWVCLHYVDLTPVDKTFVDARIVGNDNTIVYSNIECSEIMGTYAQMAIVNIKEYNGRLAKTDLGWIFTDNLL